MLFRRCDETICPTDCFASFAKIVGQERESRAAPDSFSWIDLALGKPGAKRGEPVIHHSVTGMFSIREGKWKLILGNGSGGRAQPRGKPFEGPCQLYDMSSDIAEANGVAADNPEVLKRLTAKLRDLWSNGS